jgi:hypothetical protein
MRKQSHVLYSEHDRASMVKFLEIVSLEKPIKVTVEEHRRQRSSNQNRLYWEWLGIVAEETGYSTNELHEYCKDRFCPSQPVTIRGHMRPIRSTASLDTKDMTDYMDRVYALFVGEMGIVLPLPIAA